MLALLAALAAAQLDDHGARCELDVQGSICLNGGQQVVLPPGVPAGLVGHWTFDAQRVVDRSGNGHDAAGDVMPGPARGAGGASGLFSRNFLLVPHAELLPTAAFTYSFFIFISHHPDEDKSAAWCPVLQKGSPEQHAPALFLAPSGEMKVQLSTPDTPHPLELLSSAQLPVHQWLHIAVSLNAERLLQLTVDGMVDATVQLKSAPAANDLPLYLGGDPWTQDACLRKVALDDVRAYDRALSSAELRAEAAVVAGSDLVALGCLSCSAKEGFASCGGHHVCSGLQLHSGGLQAAARLGWWKSGTGVWTSADEGHDAKIAKLTLCCE
jgi:hypothetical protein